MPEASEGPHITPEDYVAQDEIFKVGVLRQGHHSATRCAGFQTALAFCPVEQACIRKPMAHNML